MSVTNSGIHHVTAIAGDAAKNLDFYTRVLGLRLVKKTVNYDDPGTYHLYFADETGTPGTILTFFPWAHSARGRAGVGLTDEVQLRVPESAIGFWLHRFIEKGVAHEGVVKRFGSSVLGFSDPDGLKLSLVGVPGAESETAWHTDDVAAEVAIRGFHGVALLLGNAAPTAAILTDVFGYTDAGSEGDVIRLRAGSAKVGGYVEIRASTDAPAGRMGRGSVHHVAFRAADDATQAEMRRKLTEGHRMHVTEQIDRNYFRSIYFREPGGVIFEVATDQPGFAIDEPVEALGSSLVLPPHLEPRRSEIEANLVPLEKAA